MTILKSENKTYDLLNSKSEKMTDKRLVLFGLFLLFVFNLVLWQLIPIVEAMGMCVVQRRNDKCDEADAYWSPVLSLFSDARTANEFMLALSVGLFIVCFSWKVK